MNKWRLRVNWMGVYMLMPGKFDTEQAAVDYLKEVIARHKWYQDVAYLTFQVPA